MQSEELLRRLEANKKQLEKQVKNHNRMINRIDNMFNRLIANTLNR